MASISSFVFAQNNNSQTTNQARLLLEVQAMRQEIAELRDLVERQQFELSKIQQAQQITAARLPVQRYDSLPQTSQDPVSTQSGILSNAATVNYGADSSVPVSGAGGSTESTPLTAETPNSIPNGTSPGVVEGNPPVYQPYDPTSQGTVTQPGTVAGSASNRGAVTAQAGELRTPPLDASGRPIVPVEERSVAAPNVSGSVSPDSDTALNNGSVLGANGAGNLPSTNGAAIDNTGTQVNPNIRLPSLPASGTNVTNNTGIVQVPTTATVSATNQVVPQSQVGGSPEQQHNTSLATAPTPIRLSETEYYQQGFDLLKQSKHAQAVSIFQQQISTYPQGDYADDAYYWIAESMYVNRNLEVSKQHFKAIIDNYKQSPRLPDALLKTAYIQQEQGNVIEARILLQEIMQFHPRSNAAISAKNRLAQLN